MNLTERQKTLLRGCELVQRLSDADTDLAKLVAQAMQTGYDLCWLELKPA